MHVPFLKPLIDSPKREHTFFDADETVADSLAPRGTLTENADAIVDNFRSFPFLMAGATFTTATGATVFGVVIATVVVVVGMVVVVVVGNATNAVPLTVACAGS